MRRRIGASSHRAAFRISDGWGISRSRKTAGSFELPPRWMRTTKLTAQVLQNLLQRASELPGSPRTETFFAMALREQAFQNSANIKRIHQPPKSMVLAISFWLSVAGRGDGVVGWRSSRGWGDEGGIIAQMDKFTTSSSSGCLAGNATWEVPLALCFPVFWIVITIAN